MQHVHGGGRSRLLNRLQSRVVFPSCLLSPVGSDWFTKLYGFQAYESTTRHLHIVVCARHPRSRLHASPFVPPVPSSSSPPPAITTLSPVSTNFFLFLKHKPPSKPEANRDACNRVPLRQFLTVLAPASCSCGNRPGKERRGSQVRVPRALAARRGPTLGHGG